MKKCFPCSPKCFYCIPICILVCLAVFFVLRSCAHAADPKPSPTAQPATALPKLIELGSKGCIPCGMMEPILADFKKNRAHQFEVVFYDVREKEGAKKAKPYKIRTIPTQVFEDKDGKELFRHEGFYSKENILKKWRELGYDFK